MDTRLSEVFRWFVRASLPLAAAVFALAAGSDDPGARGDDIKGLATAAGVGGQAEPTVATPARGATAPAGDRDNGGVRPSTPGGATMCRLPDWLPGTWVFSHLTITERSKTSTYPDSMGRIPVPIPKKLAFTQGSPTYEFTGGLVPPGKAEITSVTGEVTTAAIWPFKMPAPFSEITWTPVTIARGTEGITIEFSAVVPHMGSAKYKAVFTRVPEHLALPEWLPGRWGLARATMIRRKETMVLGADPQTMAMSPVPVTLVFTQGSPVYEYSGGPFPTGKDVIVTLKEGAATIFAPFGLSVPVTPPIIRATVTRTPEGIVVEMPTGVSDEIPPLQATYTRLQDHPELPGWLPGHWVLTRATTTRAGEASAQNSEPAPPVLVPMALSFAQGNPFYEFTGGPIPPGRGVVSVKDGATQVTLWPTKMPLASATITQDPEGIAVDFSITAEGGRDPSRCRVVYARVPEHPELPGWLPGKWVLASSTTTPAGGPSTPRKGMAPFPMVLAFTQGSPTYEYAVGPVRPGKGVIFPRGEGASMTTWPVFPPPPDFTRPLPPTSDASSSTPATVVEAPEGIVVEVSLMINAREPVRYRGVYTRFQERPELPAWLPGKWSLTQAGITRAQNVPTSMAGAFGIPETLIFTQGNPNYDRSYSGGMLPGGKGEVIAVKEDVASLSANLANPLNPWTLGTVARAEEGIEVKFSVGGMYEFWGLYSRGQEHPELPGWLPGKWILSHHTMTDAGHTSDFPAGTGMIQIATTLTFTQGSPDYDYAGGPVPPGKGKVSVRSGAVRITLWPTNVFSLPATVAKTPEGIVVEFSNTIHGNEPSKFQAFYKRAPE